jgi:hypothetical protein
MNVINGVLKSVSRDGNGFEDIDDFWRASGMLVLIHIYIYAYASDSSYIYIYIYSCREIELPAGRAAQQCAVQIEQSYWDGGAVCGHGERV